MSHNSLNTVFRSVVISKLSYASPAWIGFARENDKDRIEAFIRRGKRAGFCTSSAPTFKEICRVSDQRLFQSVTHDQSHVLYRLLPPKTESHYQLRPRAHAFVLPLKENALLDSNFINRLLYEDYSV